jgi:hypothetical protein
MYAQSAPKLPAYLRPLRENLRLIHAELRGLRDRARSLSKLPAVRTPSQEHTARPLVIASSLIDACSAEVNDASITAFLQAVQEIEPFRLAELWATPSALQLALFTAIVGAGETALAAPRGDLPLAETDRMAALLRSFRVSAEIDWQVLLEEISLVHQTLLLDPGGVYARMDVESRDLYRNTIERIAVRSDVSEIELARRAVNCADRAVLNGSTAEARNQRLKHAGYYLIDKTGAAELLHEIGFRPSFGQTVQRLMRRFPDEVYVIGIEFLSLITVVALILSLVRSQPSWGLVFGALLLLLPATQAAVEVMNYLVTSILSPSILPKIDFTNGVDPNSATIVAVPTLLINDKQIRQLANDLEVRYLANRDAHIFFALLTDLPDTAEPAEEQDHRVELATELIESLNSKYSSEPFGGFYLFHRHRVFNPREGSWMGWERKRGKLLDLNQLLRGVYDPFPVKIGDLSRLPSIRYVITLDSDTKLPRGSAQRLVGAMAHPLNRPLIDPELNIVTEGYGILQPRVGISVQSSTRSRLANIYSGQTGFDIYSRAVSDVYQDLYGEGIFTGKGIYDVDALRQVLERRFPRNTLLSHDLIEGAYARVGLVSDVEVIDDYPSHYSAYNRRRHRWLRGDWQIVRWIFSRVPNESRRLVRNPISLASKWKIIDNLRRSLIEPATFVLLLCGWLFLPGGPLFWTLVTICLLFLPIYFRLILSLARGAWNFSKPSAQEAVEEFLKSHVAIVLNVAFMAHQMLVAVDAIVRTIVRSTITHSRLLEWETATEAELSIRKRTPVDVYLDWVPLVAIPIGIAAYFRLGAFACALPFIVLWSCSKLIALWLDRSPHAEALDLTGSDQVFLREIALRTWRYFCEFSKQANHWLIPDNVQQNPHRIAERISPTNLGLLLNARQSAFVFGYLTLSEFVTQTERTLATMRKLPRHFGHFLNWYDTVTLAPLRPEFISSVDSGNLVASLWSLKNHCLELQQSAAAKPILSGLADYYRLAGVTDAPPSDVTKLPSEVKGFGRKQSAEQQWWLAQTNARLDAVRRESSLMDGAQRDLSQRLRNIANECDQFIREMDFRILVDARRKLLSVGYDVTHGQLAKSCYDLLASEARIGTFVAVAKTDAAQETWFRLGRQHTICERETALVSWTGTMFEYLMPMIWMRSHADTLLDRSTRAAVRAQRRYGTARRVPWGISEAAYSGTDEAGNYQYAAFGVPGLALNVARADSLVISPYSSCLALMVDTATSVANLRRMKRLDWLAEYGFFESADFTGSRRRAFARPPYALVRCWMSHHQGMTLASLCNLFSNFAFQRWFHAERLVQASELVLQERPLRAKPVLDASLKMTGAGADSTP